MVPPTDIIHAEKPNFPRVYAFPCVYGEIADLPLELSLAKNCLYFLPLSHSAPPLPMFPLEFPAEVNREETKSSGYSNEGVDWSFMGTIGYNAKCVHR